MQGEAVIRKTGFNTWDVNRNGYTIGRAEVIGPKYIARMNDGAKITAFTQAALISIINKHLERREA